MIQNRQRAEVISTIPTQNKVTMGIREEDMPKIMGLLIDLYKDKLAALIREYSTNALDANIQVGSTNPIRVTLPTALSPFFIIQDDGPGLDEQDITEVYSQYGRSTKDATNAAVGMFGLGCKSALTYTNQFTVSSVKNGQEIVVIVSREGDGAGACSTISAGPTDKPNGTEVKIAINRADYYRAEQLAKTFYSYWQPGTVEVNGEQPERFTGMEVTPDLFITQEGGSKAVMGNVAYPTPELDDLCPRGSVVAYVPIGSAEIPPNRESLQESEATTKCLKTIRDQFEKGIKGAVQREIDKASDPMEAVRVACEWDRYVPGGGTLSTRYRHNHLTGYTYKGTQIAAYIESTMKGEKHTDYRGNVTYPLVPFIVTEGGGSYRRGCHSIRTKIAAETWETTVWCKGFTPGKFAAQHKDKLRKMCENKGIDLAQVRQFVCVRGPMPDAKAQPGVGFIPSERILDWDEVRKLRLEPRTVNRYGQTRIAGSYDLVTENGRETGIPGDQIRQDQPIFYFQGNYYKYRRWETAMMQNYKRFTVVLLTANRVGKFTRNVPTAKTVKQAIEVKRDEWIKMLTQDQRDAIWLRDEYVSRTFKKMDAAKVDDPKIKRAIKLANMNIDALARPAGCVQPQPRAAESRREDHQPAQPVPAVRPGRRQGSRLRLPQLALRRGRQQVGLDSVRRFV